MKLKVAYSGVPGCFAEEAAIRYFGGQSASGKWQDVCELVPTGSFAAAFQAVADGKADRAVLPIENSSTGSIIANYDLITQYGFYIVGEQSVEVSQCLMAKPGTTTETITEVFSHQQGLSQSREYLSRYPWKQTEVYNTAYAAQMVAESERTDIAAIAAARAAELYGLEILQEKTNFKDINQTRFVILAPEVHHSPDNNKVSLMVTLPHTPGSLCRLLSIFAREQINLLKIESRPVAHKNWEYLFFIDFSADTIDARIREILQEISDFAQTLRVLGYYKKFDL
jgi:chorismate mutase/prephenate dehydratase